MTVPLSDRKSGPYTATAGQTVFNYGYKIDDEAHIEVLRVRDDVEATLELNVDYTVTGVGEEAGGTIVLAVGAEEGDVITTYGRLPIERVANFPGWRSIPNNAIDQELDRMTIALQEMARDVARSIQEVEGLDSFDLGGRRLINVGEGVNPSDAATMGQIEPFATSAAASADAAAASEAAAAASEAAAGLSQDAAAASEAAAAASEANAASSAAAALAAAEASGAIAFYDTKAGADSALGGLSEGDVVEVLVDEERGGLRTRYRVESGVLVFKLFLGKNVEIWVSPDGDDDTGFGTVGAPYATLGKALSVASSGATIRCGPNLTVEEEIDLGSLTGVSILGDAGNPILMRNVDEFDGEWTLVDDATYTYTATISHDWGGSGTKTGADRFLPTLLQGTRRLQEIRVGTAAGDYQYATEEEVLAQVEAREGTFYVQGKNGSSYLAGWESGDQEYYVHPFGSDDANNHEWWVVQRRAPNFGERNRVSNAVVLGGVHRDGIGHNWCLLENVRCIYPAGHGFIGASLLVDCSVEGGNLSVGGVNAFHGFGSSTWREKLHLIRPKVRDYNGPGSNIVNTHGVSTGVDTLGVIEVDDLDADNVIVIIGGVPELRDGVILRRPKVRNATVIGEWGGSGNHCDIRIEEPDIQIVSTETTNQFMFGNVAAGQTIEFVGGRVVGDTQLFRALGGGTIRGYGTVFIFGADAQNQRWHTTNGTFDGFHMERCVLYCADGAHQGAMFDNFTGTPPVTFTDCALGNIEVPSSATLTRTVQCDPRVRKGNGDHIVIELPDSALHDLGHLTIAAASPQTSSALRNTLILTGSGVYNYDWNLCIQREWSSPDGVSFNGIAYVGDGTDRYWVLYGDGGTLYKSAGGSTFPFSEVSTGRTVNWIGHVTQEDGEVLLLGDGGEITRYVPSTDSFTDETSGVTYPLKHGLWDGSNFYVVGGDGSADGGILQSSDGETWTEVYNSTNAEFLTCIAKVSGVWMAFTSRGQTMFTSSDGSTWTATTSSQIRGRVEGCLTDTVRNRVLFWGKSADDRFQTRAFVFSDISGTTVTNWTREELSVPATGIKAGAYNRYVIEGSSFVPMFVLVAPLARVFVSQDGRDWLAGSMQREDKPSRSNHVNPAIAQMLAQA